MRLSFNSSSRIRQAQTRIERASGAPVGSGIAAGRIETPTAAELSFASRSFANYTPDDERFDRKSACESAKLRQKTSGTAGIVPNRPYRV